MIVCTLSSNRVVHSKLSQWQLPVQGKLSDVDVSGIEERLTEVTNRYNDAKRRIAEAKAKLEKSKRDADNLQQKADDLVPCYTPLV
jgi:chromosome segregation ATPase